MRGSIDICSSQGYIRVRSPVVAFTSQIRCVPTAGTGLFRRFHQSLFQEKPGHGNLGIVVELPGRRSDLVELRVTEHVAVLRLRFWRSRLLR